MHVGKNDCFIAICNHAAFLKPRNSYFSTLTGSHEITKPDSKHLTPLEWSLRTYYSENMCFFNEDMVRGRNSLGVYIEVKIKHR